MLATLEHNARELGLEVETAACDAVRAAVRGRDASTSCSATPSCTTCPTSTAASREFMRVLKPGGTLFFAGEPSPLGRQARRVPQARRGQGRAAVAQGDEGAARAGAPRRRRGRARAGGRRGRPRVRPVRPRQHATRGPGSTTSRCAARSCWRTGSAGSTARWRPAPSPRTSRGAGSSTPTSGYILLQRVDRSAAGAAPAAADLLQPDARGAQARVSQPPEEHPPSPVDMLRDQRAMVDTTRRAGRVRDRLRDLGT